MNLPCVEHGRVSRDINNLEHNFGTSSRQISSINVAFRKFSDIMSKEKKKKNKAEKQII